MEVLQEILLDGDVLKYTGFRKPPSRVRQEELISTWTSSLEGHNPGVFGAFDRAGIFVAWLMLKPNERSEMEIGFMLPRECWGMGYATELCKGLLEYGFAKLNLACIVAHCDSENQASQKVLEKAGMQRKPSNRGSIRMVLEASKFLVDE